MVNENELKVVKKYEVEGWKTLRGGAPDFLFLRVKDGKIKDAVFVEVKREGDRLTYEQSIYKEILERMGAKYRVEIVKPTCAQTTSFQSTSIPMCARPDRICPPPHNASHHPRLVRATGAKRSLGKVMPAKRRFGSQVMRDPSPVRTEPHQPIPSQPNPTQPIPNELERGEIA